MRNGLFFSCLSVDGAKRLETMKTPDNSEYQNPNANWLSYRALHDLNAFTANLVRLDMTADVSYLIYEAAISEARAFVNRAKVGEKEPNLSNVVNHIMASGSMKIQQLSMLITSTKGPAASRSNDDKKTENVPWKDPTNAPGKTSGTWAGDDDNQMKRIAGVIAEGFRTAIQASSGKVSVAAVTSTTRQSAKSTPKRPKRCKDKGMP